LLHHLENPNYRTRYFARRELQQRNPDDVIPVVKQWLGDKAPATEADFHKQVEALWLYQGLNQYDTDYLKKLLRSPEHHVRTAALRVLRYWQNQMSPDESLALLKAAVLDENERVRLEALVDLGYHADPHKALPVAALVLDQEMDAGMIHATRETLSYLISVTGGIEKASKKVDHFMLPFSSDEELSSRRLTDAVAEEILKRSTLPRAEHQRAIDFITRESGGKSSSLKTVVARLEQKDTRTSSLEALLLTWPPAEVTRDASVVERLLGDGEPSGIRTAAQAALFRAGVTGDKDPVLKSTTLLAMAAGRAGRGKTPERYFEKFASGLQMKKPTLGAMTPLMIAVAGFPSKNAEALKLLAEVSDRFQDSNIDISFAALDAMKRIPKDVWPPEYANKTLSKVTITASPNLKFLPDHFSVKAGSAVELRFMNPDNLYHNLVILKPGSLEEVGLKADLMAGRPDGLDKNYVPDDPNVLHWTPQITLGIARSYTLKFFAPNEAGDYPYICTFPGHWRVMRGVMKVSR